MSMDRHIDGIVLLVKQKIFVSLRAWQANFHLQAIEYYIASLRVYKRTLLPQSRSRKRS